MSIIVCAMPCTSGPRAFPVFLAPPTSGPRAFPYFFVALTSGSRALLLFLLLPHLALCIPTVSLAPRRPHVRPRPQGADPGFGPRCAPRLTGADSMVLSPHRRCVSAASTKPTCPESCCAGRSLCFFPNAYPFSYISHEKGTTHPFRHRVCPE